MWPCRRWFASSTAPTTPFIILYLIIRVTINGIESSGSSFPSCRFYQSLLIRTLIDEVLEEAIFLAEKRERSVELN
jgi:hypothetical protein